eukprot:jgi/Mesvir1/7210/Mv19031-RA.1
MAIDKLEALREREFVWLKSVTISQFRKEVARKERPVSPSFQEESELAYEGRPKMWVFRETRSHNVKRGLSVYADSLAMYNDPPALPPNDERWPRFIPWSAEPKRGDERRVYLPDRSLMDTNVGEYKAQCWALLQRSTQHEELMGFFQTPYERGIPWHNPSRSQEDQRFLLGENRPIRVFKAGPRDCLMMHAFMAVPESQKELAYSLLVDGYTPLPVAKRARLT